MYWYLYSKLIKVHVVNTYICPKIQPCQSFLSVNMWCLGSALRSWGWKYKLLKCNKPVTSLCLQVRPGCHFSRPLGQNLTRCLWGQVPGEWDHFLVSKKILPKNIASNFQIQNYFLSRWLFERKKYTYDIILSCMRVKKLYCCLYVGKPVRSIYKV